MAIYLMCSILEETWNKNKSSFLHSFSLVLKEDAQRNRLELIPLVLGLSCSHPPYRDPKIGLGRSLSKKKKRKMDRFI